ncbi:MAG: hypothetical protein NVS3B24_18510 [Candidatus Dormibacteria bacterium]
MRRLTWASTATVLFAIPHSFEDFQNGVPARFGLSVLVAGSVLGVAFAVQVLATAMAESGNRAATIALMVIGTTWLLGAVADHGRDVLRADWRSGVPSRLLVAGLAGAALSVVILAFADLRRKAKQSQVAGDGA